ncbi:LysR family transcriptional regulator [Comamonas testosteroni]
MKKNLSIQRDSLNALSTFVLVARVRSFTQAGNQLGISASAVSQQMRKLEAQLDVRLLQRNSRQVSVTEAGEQLLAEVTPSLEQLDLAMQRVRAAHDEPTGLLRINTSRLAAGLLITPRLDAFLARYPRIQLELFTDDAFSDIVQDGFDAGIRLGTFLARDMVSLPLDQGQWEAVVASPAYWQAHGMPQTPADLALHDCIRFRLPGSKRFVPWIFMVDGKEQSIEPTGRLIFSDDAYVTRAACQGYGVAHKFVGSIQEELATGLLVPALQSFERPWSGFHIYYPARKQMPPKLRAFIDFLREAPPV